MKILKRVVLIISVSVFLVATSCSSNEDNNPCGNTEQMVQIASTYNNALGAYRTSATAENCASLKSAGQNYIALLKELLSCANLDQQELREDITNTEAELESAC